MRDAPSALADRVFVEELFRGHPYGHLPIGTEESLEVVGLDDVRAFHSQSYRHERATLVLVGDVDYDRGLSLGRPVVLRGGRRHRVGRSSGGRPRLRPMLGREAMIVHRPNAQQSELRSGDRRGEVLR